MRVGVVRRVLLHALGHAAVTRARVRRRVHHIHDVAVVTSRAFARPNQENGLVETKRPASGLVTMQERSAQKLRVEQIPHDLSGLSRIISKISTGSEQQATHSNNPTLLKTDHSR